MVRFWSAFGVAISISLLVGSSALAAPTLEPKTTSAKALSSGIVYSNLTSIVIDDVVTELEGQIKLSISSLDFGDTSSFDITVQALNGVIDGEYSTTTNGLKRHFDDVPTSSQGADFTLPGAELVVSVYHPANSPTPLYSYSFSSPDTDVQVYPSSSGGLPTGFPMTLTLDSLDGSSASTKAIYRLRLGNWINAASDYGIDTEPSPVPKDFEYYLGTDQERFMADLEGQERYNIDDFGIVLKVADQVFEIPATGFYGPFTSRVIIANDAGPNPPWLSVFEPYHTETEVSGSMRVYTIYGLRKFFPGGDTYAYGFGPAGVAGVSDGAGGTVIQIDTGDGITISMKDSAFNQAPTTDTTSPPATNDSFGVSSGGGNTGSSGGGGSSSGGIAPPSPIDLGQTDAPVVNDGSADPDPDGNGEDDRDAPPLEGEFTFDPSKVSERSQELAQKIEDNSSELAESAGGMFDFIEFSSVTGGETEISVTFEFSETSHILTLPPSLLAAVRAVMALLIRGAFVVGCIRILLK